ncbi:unnamed protein product [Brassicogethes aeneus]|uniref:Dynein light chain n=1 Tax=Brassicogethes aeneus TaxID=1431903 RepID=A0A9P0AR46_BRAAE|nr:unnamed protein product [Brassicogethes aeneus]
MDDDDDDLSNKRLSELTVQETQEVFKEQSHESILPQTYQIKPSLEEKFKEVPVKEIIRNILTETLGGKTYEAEKVKKLTISIANDVNTKIKELQMKRYRHIVQVIIGEMKGAGVKSGVRCIWDSECDGYTSEIFMNDYLFCVTTVFAVYFY